MHYDFWKHNFCSFVSINGPSRRGRELWTWVCFFITEQENPVFHMIPDPSPLTQWSGRWYMWEMKNKEFTNDTHSPCWTVRMHNWGSPTRHVWTSRYSTSPPRSTSPTEQRTETTVSEAAATQRCRYTTLSYACRDTLTLPQSMRNAPSLVSFSAESCSKGGWGITESFRCSAA